MKAGSKPTAVMFGHSHKTWESFNKKVNVIVKYGVWILCRAIDKTYNLSGILKLYNV